jgi:hypothetical protein
MSAIGVLDLLKAHLLYQSPDYAYIKPTKRDVRQENFADMQAAFWAEKFKQLIEASARWPSHLDSFRSAGQISFSILTSFAGSSDGSNPHSYCRQIIRMYHSDVIGLNTFVYYLLSFLFLV